MANLFLIDGASGTGKSDLLELVKSYPESCGVLIKKSTRKRRDNERNINSEIIGLEFIDEANFLDADFDFVYSYRQSLYGFNKSDLLLLLEKFNNVFIIIRSIQTMRLVCEALKLENTNIIKTYIHSDLSKIKNRLLLQKCSKEEIDYRLSSIEEIYTDYVLNSYYYDEVIVNNSNRADYHNLIENLISKYSK